MQKNQPILTEDQWRVIHDALVAATPVGQKPEGNKEQLAWYRRSEIIQSIRSHFGWRVRRAKDTVEEPTLL